MTIENQVDTTTIELTPAVLLDLIHSLTTHVDVIQRTILSHQTLILEFNERLKLLESK